MHPFLSTKTILHRNDIPSQDVYYYKIIKDAILKYHTLPFWQYNFQGGSPFISNAEIPLIDITYLFIILFNPVAAVNFSLVFFMFLAGVGMYTLIWKIHQNQNAALLSSVIYMFNGWVFHFMGNPPTMKGYAYAPFLLMFVYLTINKKHWLKHCIFAVVIASLQLYAGSPWIFIYCNVFVFFYVLYSFITKKDKLSVIKIGLLYLILTVGLSAAVLLPAWETTRSTFRARPFSYEEFKGEDYLRLTDIHAFLIKDGQSPGYTTTIGFTAVLLLLYTLKFWKKKLVIFCWIIIIIAVLYSVGSFLATVAYHVPVINSLRHVSRGAFWFIIAASILIPYSFIDVISKEKIKRFKNYVFVLILFLLVIEIGLVGYFTPLKERYYFNLENNQLLSYLSQQEGRFRVDSIVQNVPLVRGSLVQKGIFYDLQTISPEAAFIRDEYLTFNYMALRGSLLKLWGLLNVKYVSSDVELNSTDLSFIKKFDVCTDCDQEWNPWIVGPYLYENKQFLPRAYIIKNALLISGKQEDQIPLINYIFNLEMFDPKSIVLISTEKGVGDIDFSLLERFVGVLSTDKMVTQNEFRAWLSIRDNLKEIKIKEYTPNRIKIELANESGFLVLSETFSLFPGWTAKLNGHKIDLLRANFIGTAVVLDNASGELEFTYFQKTLKIGLIISSITLLIIFYLNETNKEEKNC